MEDKKERDKRVMEKIRQARIELLAKHPFYGDLVYSMDTVLDETLDPQTAATDGDKIYYHPDYIDSLTIPETTFITGHEVTHAAFMHIERMGNRDPQRFNIAADIVTNQQLVDNNVGTMPHGLIYDPHLYQRGNGLVTRVYDLLPEDDERNALDKLQPLVKAAPGQAMKSRARIQQARAVAKLAGNMPGNIEKLITMLDEAKVAWEDELFAEITATKGTERTYAKRNRRFPYSDTLMPGRYGETIGDIVFALDCSGSTSDAMVGQCAAEIKRAMETVRPEHVHVLYFDSNIKKHEIYGPDDELNVKVYGRGGTAFSPIFKYIEEKGIEPEHVIVATDLECDDYGPEPEYNVIWCVMDSRLNNAPWGRVINTGMVNHNDYYDEGDDW